MGDECEHGNFEADCPTCLQARIAALEAEVKGLKEYAEAAWNALAEEGVILQEFEDWNRDRRAALARADKKGGR